jgi:hypothetical protein
MAENSFRRAAESFAIALRIMFEQFNPSIKSIDDKQRDYGQG